MLLLVIIASRETEEMKIAAMGLHSARLHLISQGILLRRIEVLPWIILVVIITQCAEKFVHGFVTDGLRGRFVDRRAWPTNANSLILIVTFGHREVEVPNRSILSATPSFGHPFSECWASLSCALGIVRAADAQSK